MHDLSQAELEDSDSADDAKDRELAPEFKGTFISQAVRKPEESPAGNVE